MKKIMSVIAVISLSFSGYSLAEEAWHLSKIQGVFPQGNGEVILSFMSDNPKCLNGETPYKNYYLAVNQNGVTENGLRNIYSAALAAASAGKEVKVAFDPSTKNCYINKLQMIASQ